MGASCFDAHSGLQFALRASMLCLLMSTSGFGSSSEGISDFELQGVRLLPSSRTSGKPCWLRRMPSASAGWGGADTPEAASSAEAGFRANQTIITHFYKIITTLLPVMKVIMALLLHIFTSLWCHYYVLSACYYVIITCHYCNNGHYYLLLQ